MKKIKICTLIILIFALPFTALALELEKENSEKIDININAEGIGITHEEAVADALREAVRYAVGEVIKGGTDLKISQISAETHEEIAAMSRAFISGYEELNRHEDGGIYHVEIKAKIKREDLINIMLEKKPDIANLSISVNAVSRKQQVQAAGDILIDFIKNIPIANFVKVNTKTLDFTPGRGKSGKLKLAVNFSFDRERYFSQLVPKLVSMLNYIADSRMTDIPFIIPVEIEKNENNNSIVITPPDYIRSMDLYRQLMELEDGSRYIDEFNGEFANVYIMTKNYYFNAYKIPEDAFIRLVEAIFLTDRRKMLTGRIAEGAELKLDFKADGVLLFSHNEPLQLHNILFFMNMPPLNRSPWSTAKHDALSEQSHAVFILPTMGKLNDNDYILIPNDNAELTLDVKTADLYKNALIHSSIKVFFKK